MSRVVTRLQAIGIGKLVDSIEIKSKITIIPSDGRQARIAGTLRHMSPSSGSAAYAPDSMDVRDTYVRITTIQGFETWILFSELVEAYLEGQMLIGVAVPDDL